MIRTPGPYGKEVSIRIVSEILTNVMPQSDLRYLGKLYKDAFKGSDGVSALVKAFDLSDRNEAVEFGRSLQKRHKLLDHVKSEHDFGDNSYFFRLLPFDSNSPGGGDVPLERLQHAAFHLKSNVEVKDRRFLLKVYPNCFVGREAVTLLVTKGHAMDRDEAVRMGVAMQSELGLFEHVTGDHVFKDEELFYRFK